MYTGYQEIRQRNPRETCNILSFLTFAYTIELFKKGIRGNIEESDIYEVPKSCNSKRCGDKLEKEWEHCKSVSKLLWRRFGLKYTLYSCIHLSWKLLHNTVFPYGMSRLIAYFEKDQTQYSKNDAYYYGGIVILITLFRHLWIHNYYLLECILSVQIKSSLTSLIYRKVLKLRPENLKGSSMGNIVTILTKDIRSVISTMWAVSDLLIGFVQFVNLSYLLYSRIGPPSLIAVGVLAFGTLIQAFLSQFIMKMRLRVGKMADKRLHFTREVLSVLKIIKMYTWEVFFHARICDARKKETKANLALWYFGSVITSLGTLLAKMIFPFFMLSYISLGYSINTELIYYLMSIFKEFDLVVGRIIPMGFALRSEIHASIIRIGKVLNMEEQNDKDTCCEELILKEKKIIQPKIDFQNASIVIGNEPILSNICLLIEKPGLYMVTGLLGSGKSSLIRAILKEYAVTNGHGTIAGTMSYASQDPWLFPASVQQNILFGEHYNRIRYDEVVRDCCLEYDFKVLPNGDNTIITDGGLNLSKGQQARVNLARAIYKDSDIYLLDDPLAGLDVKVQEDIFNNCIRNFLKEKIVIFVTQNSQHLRHAKEVIVLNRGEIKSILKPEEIFQDELVNPAFVDAAEKDDLKGSTFSRNKEFQTNIYHENKNIGKVDIKNYYSYIKNGGGVLIFGVIIAVFFAAQLADSLSEKLLSKWVDYQQYTFNKSTNSNYTSAENITIIKDDLVELRDSSFNLYIIMIAVSAGIDLIRLYIFLAYCRRSSIKFHKAMCQSIINCVMPFMDNHFIGNILNRFSYDLDQVDEPFPCLFMDLIKSFFAIGGTIVLILTVNWMFLFVSILFFVTLLGIRMLYIPAARALKRLGAITRSPFIGHLNATVAGISTIKAFKAESLLKEEFDKHQDLAISTFYMETVTQRAFGYALDFDCNIFLTLIILTFLLLDTDTSVGNVGLALTQVFALSGNLQWIIRVWSELETCMTSVERVVEYTEIPQEDKNGKILNNWPQKGKIVYEGINLIYNFESKVLKDINFTINAGEKIGIVGRTGAGKSSIISTLFRLYDYQGKIRIDDTDITTVSLESLRRNLSIIPQDPIIFEGSVRANIDPHVNYQDQEIWNVIKKVKMEKIVKNLDINILDLTLSTGQKQLLCLARTLLQNNKIVVMDEPTANLDLETDELVHNLVRENFGNCTIIIVAHRLNSVLDCDKVMVMEYGSIVEYDNPRNLLANQQSLFYKMINTINIK